MKIVFLALTLTFSAMATNECAKVGEEWYPFLPGSGYKSCCEGLIATTRSASLQKGEKCAPNMPGASGFCVKCGDGKCDKEHFENSCNCKQDCK